MLNSHAGNKALNYSLEFSGTSTTVTFNEDMDIKTIDSEVTPVVEEVTGDKNVQPTKVVGTNQGCDQDTFSESGANVKLCRVHWLRNLRG